MSHNHIYSDSVSCERLKAVDIISKEEGHVCPTNPLTKQNNNKQTNKRKIYQYSTILRYQQQYFLKYLGVQHITYRMSLGVQFISMSCQSTLCLHLPQCSELTCCCLIILCYAKLFIKKNLLLTMYYKENCMWNSIIVIFIPQYILS